MVGRRVAVRLESFGVSAREAIALAARIGAEAVEFDALGELSSSELSRTGRRELRHVLQSQGLALAAVGFPTRHGYDHLDRLDARIEATTAALALSYELGCGIVINHIGKIPAVDASVHRAAFLDAMRRVANECDRVGARLAIQTGLDRPEVLKSLLDELGSNGLAVNYSPANLVALGVDLDLGIEQLHSWIVGCHVRDVVRSGVATTGVRDVPLGQGEIDWRRLFETFASVDYRGHYTIVREPASTSLVELSNAVETVRG